MKNNVLSSKNAWELRDFLAKQDPAEVIAKTNGQLAADCATEIGCTITARNIETALADVGIVRPKRDAKALPVASDELRQIRADILALAEVIRYLTPGAGDNARLLAVAKRNYDRPF